MLRKFAPLFVLLIIILAVAGLFGCKEAPIEDYSIEVVQSSDIYYTEAEFYSGVQVRVTEAEGLKLLPLTSTELVVSPFTIANGEAEITVTYKEKSSTFTVLFAVQPYTVKYMASSGGFIEGKATQSVTYGQSTTPVTAVAEVGYVFTKWTDGVTERTRKHDSVGKASAQLEVYAVFEKIGLQITVYNNEGEVARTLSVKYGNIMTAPQHEQITGKEFVGWINKSTKQTVDFSQPITASLHISPVYTAIYNTVSFYSYVDGSLEVWQSYQVAYGAAFTEVLPEVPQVENKRFDKWIVLGSAYSMPDLTCITEDLALEPIYTRIVLTVNFDGQLNSYSLQRDVYYGETVTAPSGPLLCEGYVFVGWRLSTETNALYDFSTPVTQNIQLLAVWIDEELEVYTVTVLGYDGSVHTTFRRLEGQKLGVLEPLADTAARDFVKFTDSYGHDYDSNTTVNADMEILSVWENNYYTVSFLSSSPVETDIPNPQDITLLYGGYITEDILPSLDGQLNSHTFIGWFVDGEPFNNALPITKDVTLSAKWQILTYTVSIRESEFGVRANLGTGNKIVVEYGANVTVVVTVSAGVMVDSFRKNVGNNSYLLVPAVSAGANNSTVYSFDFSGITTDVHITYLVEYLSYTVDFSCEQDGIESFEYVANRSTGVVDFPEGVYAPTVTVYYDATLCVGFGLAGGWEIVSVKDAAGTSYEVSDDTVLIKNVTSNLHLTITLQRKTISVVWSFQNADGSPAEPINYEITVGNGLTVYYISTLPQIAYGGYVTVNVISESFFNDYDVYINGVLTLIKDTEMHVSASKFRLSNLSDDVSIVFKHK